VAEARPVSRAPPAEIGLRPIEPVDISRDEPISAPADAVRRSGQPRPAARRNNPFKRLIIWSLMLGLGLLVGALIVLVT